MNLMLKDRRRSHCFETITLAIYPARTNGKLVDWQAETGDGGPVEEFLCSSVKQGELTLDKALEIAGTNPDSNSDAKVE